MWSTGKRHKTTKRVCGGILLSTALPCRDQKTHNKMPQRCIQGKSPRPSIGPSHRTPPRAYLRPGNSATNPDPCFRSFPVFLHRLGVHRKVSRGQLRPAGKLSERSTFIFRLSGAHLENLTRPFRPSRTLSQRSTPTPNVSHHRGAQRKTRSAIQAPQNFLRTFHNFPYIPPSQHRGPENLARPPRPARKFS